MNSGNKTGNLRNRHFRRRIEGYNDIIIEADTGVIRTFNVQIKKSYEGLFRLQVKLGMKFSAMFKDPLYLY